MQLDAVRITNTFTDLTMIQCTDLVMSCSDREERISLKNFMLCNKWK